MRGRFACGAALLLVLAACATEEANVAGLSPSEADALNKAAEKIDADAEPD